MVIAVVLRYSFGVALRHRHPLESYPTGRRSKYFPDVWQEWIERNTRDLKRVMAEYPTDGIPRKPDSVLSMVNQEKYAERFYDWLQDLKQAGHPYAEAWFYEAMLKASGVPKFKSSWQYDQSRHGEVLETFRKRIEQIDQIDREREQEQERYQRELAHYREQTSSPISQQVLLLSRYESHIAKQLREAFGFAMPSANAQLQSLQQQRETKAMLWSN